MVAPHDTIGRTRRRGAPVAALAVALAAATTGPGCGLVSQNKLDDCHRVSQTLRAENSRLKDVALDLRAQTQDLGQRAVDDARRIAEQEEAVTRLETSVHAYQAEREQMAAALEAVKRGTRIAASPHEAALPARLKAFAEAREGWSFDDSKTGLTLSVPADRLFETQADRLLPKAAEALQALADEYTGRGADALTLEIAAQADSPSPPDTVEQAGYEPGRDREKDVSARFLAAARGAKVRDRLVTAAGLEPSDARLAAPARRDGKAGARVEIRLRKRDENPEIEGRAAKSAAPDLDASPKVHP